MSRDIGQKAIDMFVQLAEGGKSIEFIFTGGEPVTQFPTMEDLTGYAQQRTNYAGMNAYFVLKTNGTILNRPVIDFICKYSVKVVISIDGTPAARIQRRFVTEAA